MSKQKHCEKGMRIFIASRLFPFSCHIVTGEIHRKCLGIEWLSRILAEVLCSHCKGTHTMDSVGTGLVPQKVLPNH